MRARSGKIHHQRRSKTLKLAKGFRGARSKIYTVAKQAVMKAGMHGFASRRQKKRQMRSLWVVRINAGVREHGLSYSRFMHNLAKAQIQLDRRSLADLAMNDPEGFAALVKNTAG